MGETTYAAAALGKISILLGWARRRTISMAYTRYGVCVHGLLSLFGLRQRLNFGEREISGIFVGSCLIPT